MAKTIRPLTVNIALELADGALFRKALATWLRFRGNDGIKMHSMIPQEEVGAIVQNQIEMFCKGVLHFHHQNSNKEPETVDPKIQKAVHRSIKNSPLKVTKLKEAPKLKPEPEEAAD